MKRQHYFPRTQSARPEWFANFAIQLPLANTALGLDAGEVSDAVADARYLEYAAGAWLTAVREFGLAATSALDDLYDGPGPDPFVLPTFATPALPSGVTAVGAGALQRLTGFVQAVKAASTYSEAIGLQLGVVGAEAATENPVPTFSLVVERGESSEVVRVKFRKFGRPGVAIYSRRGGGAWALLAIDLSSPYLDARPLLVPNAPEVREYRLQYYEAESPVGDFTAIESVTVAP